MISGQICGAYGSRLSIGGGENEIEFVPPGTPCHRRTFVSLRQVDKVKCSEAPWIAVHGHEYICVVTYHNSEAQEQVKVEDVFELCPLDEPEAIVSVIMGTNVQDGRGIAASLATFNEKMAIGFLAMIFRERSVFPYEETVKIATHAFCYLLNGNTNTVQIYVMGRDKKVIALPVQEIKALCDAGFEAIESKRTRSLETREALPHISSDAHHHREGMRSLETREALPHILSDAHHHREGDNIIYHRRSQVWYNDLKVDSKVASLETSWIAVQGQEAVCRVNLVTTLEKSEKPDVIKIFHVPFSEEQAIVSVALGTNEVRDESGTAAPIAGINEKSAIKFLANKLLELDALTYVETVQTAISALCCLYTGNLEAKEIEVFVARKNEKVTRALPTKEIEDLLATRVRGNSKRSCHKEGRGDLIPALLRELDRQNRGETSHGKSRISYTRETRICCSGYDSQLFKSPGVSWIAVLGKNAICVVTHDKVPGLEYLEHVLRRLKGGDLCSKWPFSTVSVVVDEVHEEIGHVASRAEIKAITLLKKKMENLSLFTYRGTIQTAISALLCLTQKDLKAEEIKACVWRNVEPSASYLETDEIQENLLVDLKTSKFKTPRCKTSKLKTIKRKALAEAPGPQSKRPRLLCARHLLKHRDLNQKGQDYQC